MNACQAVRELLAAHALGALGESEATLVTEHLAVCVACQAEEAEARACLELVTAPPVAPPPRVWGRLRERIAHERAGDDPVRDVADVADPGGVILVSCSFCRGGLEREGAVYCASCLAPHHPDCFADHGRCSVMGCGELRVVRPTASDERPALPEQPTPAPKPRWRRPRSGRWFVGGLVGAVTGAGAIAALTDDPAEAPLMGAAGLATPPPAVASPEPGPVGPPERPQRPPADRALVTAEVREVSLGELCRALEAETGVAVLVPGALEDVLVRRAAWTGAPLAHVLDDLAVTLDLELALDLSAGARPWATLTPGAAGTDRLERAGATVAHDVTWWVPLEEPDTARVVREGGLHQVAVGPPAGESPTWGIVDAPEVAVLPQQGRVQLQVGGQSAFDDGVVAALAWSPTSADLPVMVSQLPSGSWWFGTVPLGHERRHFSGPLPTAVARQSRITWSGDERWVLLRSPRGCYLAEPRADDVVAVRPEESRVREVDVGFVWGAAPDPVSGGFLVLRASGGVERWTPRKDEVEVRRLTTVPLDEGEGGWRLDVRGHLALVESDLGARFALDLLALEVHDVEELMNGGGYGGASEETSAVLQLLALDRAMRAASGVRGVSWGAWDPTDLDAPLAWWTPREVRAMASAHASTPKGPVFTAAEGAVHAVVWCGDALLVTVRRQLPRQSVAKVTVTQGADAIATAPAPPPAAPAPIVPLVEVEDPTAAGPAHEAAPGATTSDSETRTDPGEPSPPKPARTAEGQPEAEAPPTTGPLAHVRAGQRYAFAVPGGGHEVWEVLRVTADAVTYAMTLTMDGKPLGPPSEHEWRSEALASRIVGKGATRSHETLTVDGRELPCAVVRVGDVAEWFVESEGAVTFPGRVRYVREGVVVRDLVRVE